ncbi:MAG: hypothetical protein M3270_09195 [Thermoproteota archaeon]|nr:hypothetical protein [Thermoproteota archaeon]
MRSSKFVTIPAERGEEEEEGGKERECISCRRRVVIKGQLRCGFGGTQNDIG